MDERTTDVPPRVVAVDWSGAKDAAGQRKKIVAVEVIGGAATRLISGQTRDAMTESLAAMVRESRAAGAPLVIGLDFAFSLPAWFLQREGCVDAPALWARAATDGDAWLSCGVPPFWRDRAHPRPTDTQAFRQTEGEVGRAVKATPNSVFKLVGAGQVGPASVRGMPCLQRLREAGAHVWPFDDVVPGVPTVVEIWPRATYRDPKFVKSRRENRAAYLDAHGIGLDDAMRTAVIGRRDEDDDAFDALAAALALWDDRATLAALPPARSPEERLEGRIWWPRLPLGEDVAR